MKLRWVFLCLVFVLVVDYAQARFVYHDLRCMAAECRVMHK